MQGENTGWPWSAPGTSAVWAHSGSRYVITLDGEIAVLDGLEVAGGAFDAEPEQVTDASDVPAGRGVDLMQWTREQSETLTEVSGHRSIRHRVQLTKVNLPLVTFEAVRVFNDQILDSAKPDSAQLHPRSRWTCGKRFAGYCPPRGRGNLDTHSTKSRAGRRQIGLPPQLVTLLTQHPADDHERHWLVQPSDDSAVRARGRTDPPRRRAPGRQPPLGGAAGTRMRLGGSH